MPRYFSTLPVRTAFVTLFLCCAGASPIIAGDMDSHLTATYMIALRLGYTPQQAARIAAADWSMDINPNTNALPDFASTAVALTPPMAPSMAASDYQAQAIATLLKSGSWSSRGTAYHSLGTPQQVFDRLNTIRSTVTANNSAQMSDEKLAQIGQYLHATQDTYFHQHNGRPYDPEVGHLLPWHSTDYVAEHYDAALRANQATYDILKRYKDDGTLPSVRPSSEVYTTDSKAELRNIVANNTVTGISSLTAAIGRSYKVSVNDDLLTVAYNTTANYFQSGSRQTGIEILAVEPTAADLRKNLTNYWAKIGPPGSTAPGPGDLPKEMLNMQPGTKGALDYNGKDANVLIRNPAGPSPTQPSGISGLPDPNSAGLPSAAAGGGVMPGGISLSLAAARRLTIDVNLDGVLSGNGRIILSGQSGGGRRVDAALFYTAMRLACSPDDPYFSLDSDNGKLWTEQGQQASDAIWPQIRADYGLDEPLKKGGPDGLTIRSLSAKRDYAKLWATLSPRYPDLKTRLVFRPEWLRFTRFGEILYKADVLLKELDGGVPTLRPDRNLRAGNVDRYASATARSAAQSLFSVVNGSKSSGPADFLGARLWFDLTPQTNDRLPAASMLDDFERQVSPTVNRPTDLAASKVLASLSALGYMNVPRASEPSRNLAVDGSVVDLSQVYPKMFVRTHDTVTNKDVPGANPTLNTLAADVNGRIQQYVDAYDELRALTEIFRLYVAAVAYTKKEPAVCQSVEATPLLASERVQTPLPVFHSSELYFVFASFMQSGANGQKHWWFGSSSSYDGGVSPHGKEYFEKEAAVPQRTQITKNVELDAAGKHEEGVWRGASGRSNLALVPDTSAKFISGAERLKSFKPITEEMVMASLSLPPDSQPASPAGAGLLDQVDPSKGNMAKKAGGGLLDDLDPTAAGVQLLTGRP